MTRVIAHNIRSLFNVGAFFRNADAFGVEHLYLSGYTATPPREEIAKTSLGAEDMVSWSQEPDVLALMERLRYEGWRLVAFESGEAHVPINSLPWAERTAAILGNEPDGLPQEVLEAADLVVQIPMRGAKSSLNVAVASGVALYALARQADAHTL